MFGDTYMYLTYYVNLVGIKSLVIYVFNILCEFSWNQKFGDPYTYLTNYVNLVGIKIWWYIYVFNILCEFSWNKMFGDTYMYLTYFVNLVGIKRSDWVTSEFKYNCLTTYYLSIHLRGAVSVSDGR